MISLRKATSGVEDDKGEGVQVAARVPQPQLVNGAVLSEDMRVNPSNHAYLHCLALHCTVLRHIPMSNALHMQG